MIDVQDKHGIWYEARAEEVRLPGRPSCAVPGVHAALNRHAAQIEAGSAFVHYTYWDSHYDEWVPLDSSRIAEHQTKIFVSGGKLEKGHKVDVWDSHPKVLRWLEGTIVDTSETQVKVHFRGFAASLDEWIDRDATFQDPKSGREISRFQPFGHRLRRPRPFRPPAYFYWRRASRKRAVAIASSMYSRYKDALASKGLRLTPVSGDGNCMFRSVAHQVYGSDEHHDVVRQAAASYMLIERAYFAGWIADDYDAYIANLRKDGTWGDDPELQALSEVYDRPVEIWVADAKAGARVLKTMHGVRTGRTPMRLSYYGGGHYDSIVGPGFAEAHVTQAVGKREEEMLRVARLRTAPATAATAAQSASAREIASVLAASREAYADTDTSIDAALRASLEEDSQAVDASITASVVADSEVAATQQALLQHVADQAAAKEAADLEAAIRASEAAAGGVSPTAAADPELAAALAASTAGGQTSAEQDSISAAIAASLQGSGAVDEATLAAILGSQGGHGGGHEDALTEEELLRIAMQESLGGGGS